MDAAPLPQRSRKVRSRTGGDSAEILVKSEELRLEVSVEGDAVDAGPQSDTRKRRIDAAEYFGVELAVPAGRAIDVVPSSFVEFEPHLTSFSFEYLDHTADVQLHAWGPTLVSAVEQTVACMFNYMTDLDAVSTNPDCNRVVSASGHDLMSLLFNLLDEFLYVFCSEGIIVKDLKITELDVEGFKATASCKGEHFSLEKHKQGTEVKAITYSNMQINESADKTRWDIYVIIDI